MRASLPLAVLLTTLAACSAAESTDDDAADELGGSRASTLVPETAPSQAIVLANADMFAGVTELHYALLRGLFADHALDDVKAYYLTTGDFENVVTPVRAKDGDRLSAKFSTRFADEIRRGRLAKVSSAIDTNWPRDYFPLVVKSDDGAKRMIRFEYDNQIVEGVTSKAGQESEKVARSLGYDVATSQLALEGGNVLFDDEGTLFTTTKVVARNEGKSKADIEAELGRLMGAKSIVWLDPLPGELTGHVDIMAKVLGKQKVVVSASDATCPEGAPPECQARKPALDKVAKTFEARGYTVTRIASAESDGDVRPLTYANSLLVNGTVFLPAYFNARDIEGIEYLDSTEVPAKRIIAECNAQNPFPKTTETAADAVVIDRARCTLERVIPLAKRAGEPTRNYEYALRVIQHDAAAKKSYEGLGFRVVSIPSGSMINFGGSVHCVTMQIAR